MISETGTLIQTEVPDGLTGVLLGLESFGEGDVILHGPTGCRGPHSYLSEHMRPRGDVRERMNYADPIFFGQPRIPTTSMDGNDIVFGAKAKLEAALKLVAGRGEGALAIVNSPGAALIGDDLRACAKELLPGRPCAIVEMPALSAPFAVGFQKGLIAMLEALALEPACVRSRTVALLGLSLSHTRWEGSLEELRRLLGLCGLEVVCALGAGADEEACIRMASAEVLAVVHAPFADAVAPWLEARLPGRVVEGPEGAPVGYSATEAWVRAVAAVAAVDPSPALEDLRQERRRVAHLLGRCVGSLETLKGAAFAVHLEASLALPLVQWLHGYLGLLPVSVLVSDGAGSDLAQRLQVWLHAHGLADAWGRPWRQGEVDILFADGAGAMLARSLGIPALALEFPADPIPDFLPMPILGVRGATVLLEQVVRGLF
ncbi:MAG: Nitrogenase vanadium-cofactor synthesis protein VnfN [Holophagaceae bacterium]|nr:Nitrogenase vanadium-cofactor synthesis protein VnfN [Holophagaceae bacterium]